jgi:transcriptional regulator with XRE-family HTH domain
MNEAAVYLDIGRRIRTAREAKGMTQEELARFLSVAATTITAIEKGRRKVTITELQSLASTLNKSLDWLLTGNDAPDPRTVPTQPHLPDEAKKEIDDFLAYIWQKYYNHK